MCKGHSSREAIKGDPYVANTANLRQGKKQEFESQHAKDDGA